MKTSINGKRGRFKSPIANIALQNNKNLDLDLYNPFLNDFKDFSQNIFEIEGIFNDQRKKLEASLEQIPRRQRLKDRELLPKEHMLSSEEISKIDFIELRREYEKNQPPNVRDIVQPETIAMFDKFGQTGWKFVSDNLLRGSNFNDKIKIKHRTLILNKIIKNNEPNQTKIAQRMKKFE